MSSQLDMGALLMDAPAAPAALDAPTRQKLAGFIEEACGVHVDCICCAGMLDFCDAWLL